MMDVDAMDDDVLLTTLGDALRVADDVDFAKAEARIRGMFRTVCGIYAAGTADDGLLLSQPPFPLPETGAAL